MGSLLRFVTVERCPFCDSDYVIEETRSEGHHVNGTAREVRRFACSFAIEYSPNYRREQLYSDCQKNPDLLAQKARRAILSETLVRLIKTARKADPEDDVLPRVQRDVVYGLTGRFETET